MQQHINGGHNIQLSPSNIATLNTGTTTTHVTVAGTPSTGSTLNGSANNNYTTQNNNNNNNSNSNHRSPVSPNRRTRGENKKCRKVYGMERKELWCTQCKWKKACSRFGD